MSPASASLGTDESVNPRIVPPRSPATGSFRAWGNGAGAAQGALGEARRVAHPLRPYRSLRSSEKSPPPWPPLLRPSSADSRAWRLIKASRWGPPAGWAPGGPHPASAATSRAPPLSLALHWHSSISPSFERGWVMGRCNPSPFSLAAFVVTPAEVLVCRCSSATVAAAGGVTCADLRPFSSHRGPRHGPEF